MYFDGVVELLSKIVQIGWPALRARSRIIRGLLYSLPTLYISYPYADVPHFLSASADLTRSVTIDKDCHWRRQNFAPGGTVAWRTGSEVRGDKVIQKWKPSGVRSAKFACIANSRRHVPQWPMPDDATEDCTGDAAFLFVATWNLLLCHFVFNLCHDPF